MRFYDACWLATWPGRERTSSAVLERSAATWLGTQLDSSLLVLVAEVSPLLALRPRPIVSVLLCVCSLRARGEGTVSVRSSIPRAWSVPWQKGSELSHGPVTPLLCYFPLGCRGKKEPTLAKSWLKHAFNILHCKKYGCAAPALLYRVTLPPYHTRATHDSFAVLQAAHTAWGTANVRRERHLLHR